MNIGELLAVYALSSLLSPSRTLQSLVACVHRIVYYRMVILYSQPSVTMGSISRDATQ